MTDNEPNFRERNDNALPKLDDAKTHLEQALERALDHETKSHVDTALRHVVEAQSYLRGGAGDHVTPDLLDGGEHVEPFEDFDEFVDLIRVRLRDADAIDSSRLHDFKGDLTSEAEHAVIPDNWYWESFEELQAQGHLHEGSTLLNGGDACARLSADGRYYLRHGGDE